MKVHIVLMQDKEGEPGGAATVVDAFEDWNDAKQVAKDSEDDRYKCSIWTREVK